MRPEQKKETSRMVGRQMVMDIAAHIGGGYTKAIRQELDEANNWSAPRIDALQRRRNESKTGRYGISRSDTWAVGVVGGSVYLRYE